MLQRVLIVILAGLIASAPAAVGSTGPRRPPNIVVILADDLGWGDLGAYGAKDIRTPHMDRMAGEGMRFTGFYSASPFCSPARAALLTGRYPARYGVNAVFFPESHTGLPASEVTVAEALRPAGYATAWIGKWHLGHHDEHLPTRHGFDEFAGLPYSNDMRNLVYLRGEAVVDPKPDQRRLTRRVTDDAIDFIRRRREQPFLLVVAHPMPHVPLHASPEFAGRSKAGLYGDVVEELDHEVGRVTAELERLGLARDTLVFITSDNGPWLEMGDHAGSAGPFRNGKNTTFEGGMRVPGIAWWPGQVKAGSIYHGLATLMDLVPTAVELAGAPLPSAPVDGRSLVPVLTGTGGRAGPDTLAYYFRGKLEAWRSGNWKLKLPHPGKRLRPGLDWPGDYAAHETLLFDLARDPGETTDLAAARPDKVAELKAEIAAFQAAVGPAPPDITGLQPADESHLARREAMIEVARARQGGGPR